MPKNVSMDTIAKKLGLSKNTVSLALRGMPGVGARTRKLIIDTAEELGYSYSPTRRSNKSSCMNICLIVPKTARNSIWFFSFIQMGIEEESRRNNINTILHYYDESEDEFVTPLCISEGMISGIITLGRVSERTIRTIQTYGLPFVMVDQYFDSLKTDCVLTDNQGGCYIATEYLIKNGHRQIGFWGDIQASISFYDRFMGYRKALEAHNLSFDPTLSVISSRLENLVNNTATVVDVIKALRKLPTAFVCCNDSHAIVLMKALKNMGVLIPEDVSVIGFDDIEAARNVTPELTTMMVHKELMGKKAVLMLLSKLKEKEQSHEKLLLCTQLIRRNSVKSL